MMGDEENLDSMDADVITIIRYADGELSIDADCDLDVTLSLLTQAIHTLLTVPDDNDFEGNG